MFIRRLRTRRRLQTKQWRMEKYLRKQALCPHAAKWHTADHNKFDQRLADTREAFLKEHLVRLSQKNPILWNCHDRNAILRFIFHEDHKFFIGAVTRLAGRPLISHESLWLNWNMRNGKLTQEEAARFQYLVKRKQQGGGLPDSVIPPGTGLAMNLDVFSEMRLHMEKNTELTIVNVNAYLNFLLLKFGVDYLGDLLGMTEAADFVRERVLFVHGLVGFRNKIIGGLKGPPALKGIRAADTILTQIPASKDNRHSSGFHIFHLHLPHTPGEREKKFLVRSSFRFPQYLFVFTHQVNKATPCGFYQDLFRSLKDWSGNINIIEGDPRCVRNTLSQAELACNQNPYYAAAAFRDGAIFSNVTPLEVRTSFTASEHCGCLDVKLTDGDGNLLMSKCLEAQSAFFLEYRLLVLQAVKVLGHNLWLKPLLIGDIFNV